MRFIPQCANKKCRTHILQDLEPYLCPLEFCDHSAKTYATCRRLIEHLDQFHAFAAETGWSSSCIFCGQKLENSRKERIRHIGRHMEDIAFSVVPRAYNDWAFYSESDDIPKSESETEVNFRDGFVPEPKVGYRDKKWITPKFQNSNLPAPCNKQLPVTISATNTYLEVLRRSQVAQIDRADEFHRPTFSDLLFHRPIRYATLSSQPRPIPRRNRKPTSSVASHTKGGAQLASKRRCAYHN